jgi:hypothetical protein
LAKIKPLAAEYYRLTSRPLGVTGEVGELAVSELLGLELAPPRTAGYDASRGSEKIQIKCRARDRKYRNLGRMSRISVEKHCDTVLLAILDAEDLEIEEIWEAPFARVVEELMREGSRARLRGQLAVSKFKQLAKKTWPKEALKRTDTDAF